MYNGENRIRDFMNMKSLNDLYKVLNVSEKKYKYLFRYKKNLYTSFFIDKRNGDKRKIMAPCFELKKIQRDLKEILSANYEIRKSMVHGFVDGNSIKTNADIHKNANYVLNIDLKNFFDTIHFGRVRGMFMNKPFCFSDCLSTNLAIVTCYDKKLPQGAPTSPIISNIICFNLDSELSHLCKQYNCQYTRYADDITISTKMLNFPSDIAYFKDKMTHLSSNIIDIIHKQGFTINYDKVTLSPRSNRQEVTGLIVNKKVNVPKVYTKKLRALLYNTLRTGLYMQGLTYFKIKNGNKYTISEKFKEVLKGKIEFLKMIRGKEDKVYIKYAEMYNEIVDANYFDVDYGKEMSEFMENRIFPIFSYDMASQGTCFMVDNYGLVTSTHVLFNNDIFDDDMLKNLASKKNFSYDEYSNKPLYLLDHHNYIFPIYPLIKKDNIDTDVINISGIQPLKKFKVKFDYRPVKGEKVYLAGYGEFKSYKESTINYIPTTVSGESIFMNRKIWCVTDQIYHGMSGGPVLNENREVIGIIYVGLDTGGSGGGVISKSNGFLTLSEEYFYDD